MRALLQIAVVLALCLQQGWSTRLLVVGGWNGGDPLSDVELLDSASGSCPAPASLPVAMDGSVGAFLGGRAVVCANNKQCFAYDEDTDSWVHLAPMSEARHGAAVVVLDDDRLWVTGGFSAEHEAPLRSTEVYSASTDSWSPWVDLPETGLDLHCLLRIDADRVMLAGGYGPVEPTASAFVFDVAAGAWLEAPAMAVGRSGAFCGVAATADGPAVVVAGGWQKPSTEMIYLDQMSEWVSGPSLPSDLPQPGEWSHGASVPIDDGRFLAVGGWSGVDSAVFDSYLTASYGVDADDGAFVGQDVALAVPRSLFAAFRVPDDFGKC